MELQNNVLFRTDSWNIPGLKNVEILRSVSMDVQDESSGSFYDERHICAEVIAEAKATLLTTQKGQPAPEASKAKAVLQVEVHCTPGSAFDDIIKQLEDPCLPTFKLTDMPPAMKEDLFRIASPRGQADCFQHPHDQAPSLEEEIARFPLGHYQRLDDRTRSMPLPPISFDSGRPFFYPDPAPSMPLPGTNVWPSLLSEQNLQGLGHQLLPEDDQISDPSIERPAKRPRQTSADEKNGADSSSETAGSTGSGSRGKRLTCLKCGTHQTPQWRMGPEGPRTMCNACGVKYKKEQREKDKREKERRAKQQAHAAVVGFVTAKLSDADNA